MCTFGLGLGVLDNPPDTEPICKFPTAMAAPDPLLTSPSACVALEAGGEKWGMVGIEGVSGREGG
jgi:hypothetical protein